jgi:polysaccharide export outer membrane protein
MLPIEADFQFVLVFLPEKHRRFCIHIKMMGGNGHLTPGMRTQNKPTRIIVVDKTKGAELSRMSDNGKSYAACRWQRKSNLMKHLQTGLLLAGISMYGFSQASQNKPNPQTGTPAPSSATQTAPTASSTPAEVKSKPSNVSGSAGVDNAHYIIGAEDTLQVTVWKEPSLSGTIPVRPDGMISLVLVGDLRAAGRTPMQLSDDITTRLKKYIQDPNVSVLVMGVNSQKIFLVGEVGHVGPIMMTPGMTPLQAIAAAGGLTPYANSKKIYILRGEAGKQQKIPFNYKQALKGEETQSVALKPGDTIVVP